MSGAQITLPQAARREAHIHPQFSDTKTALAAAPPRLGEKVSRRVTIHGLSRQWIGEFKGRRDEQADCLALSAINQCARLIEHFFISLNGGLSVSFQQSHTGHRLKGPDGEERALGNLSRLYT